MKTLTTPSDVQLPAPPAPRRNQWLLPIGAGLTALAVLATAFTVWRPSPSAYGPAGSSPAPPALRTETPPSGLVETVPLAAFPTAITHPELLAIAGALTPAASDHQSGPVQYVRYEVWARDMDEMAPVAVRSWMRADYSAVSQKRKLPNRPPNFDAGQIGHTDFSTVEPSIVQTEAKDIAEFGKPLPADERQLFDRIRMIDRDGHTAVGDVLGIVRFANEIQVPSLATRAAILRLLAHLPELTVRPGHDRTGRAGIAITWHSTVDGADHTYIISTTTGELLAYDAMMISRTLGGPAITLPALAEAELFYERALTTTPNPAT